MENGENKGAVTSFIQGFVAGGLIGAGLALLFAPKSGRELREDIKKKSYELKSDTEELWAEGLKRVERLKDEAEQKLEEAKTKAAEIIEDGKRWAEKLRSKAEESGEEIVAEGKKTSKGK